MKHDHIFATELIGGSSNDSSTRHIGANFFNMIKEGGWKKYVDTTIKAYIECGFKRIELHNPMGTGISGVHQTMDFTQFIDVQENYPFLVKDFYQAFRPVTEMGVEVMCYVGGLFSEKLFAYKRKKYSQDNYLSLIERSLKEPINAGMTIGLDYSHAYPEETTEWKVIELLNSLGVKVYLETYPLRSMPHTWTYPSLVQEDFWWWHKTAEAAPREKVTGEVLRWLNIPFGGHTWDEWKTFIPKFVNDCAVTGETPMVAGWTFASEKIKLADLLGQKSSGDLKHFMKAEDFINGY